MKRRFRLTRTLEIKRVRRSGKSYAHPLMVLYVSRSEKSETRLAVTAGVNAGNAVKRNRAKRLMRSAAARLLPETVAGYHLMLIARSRLAESNFDETLAAMTGLFERAALFAHNHGDRISAQ